MSSASDRRCDAAVPGNRPHSQVLALAPTFARRRVHDCMVVAEVLAAPEGKGSHSRHLGRSHSTELAHACTLFPDQVSTFFRRTLTFRPRSCTCPRPSLRIETTPLATSSVSPPLHWSANDGCLDRSRRLRAVARYGRPGALLEEAEGG